MFCVLPYGGVPPIYEPEATGSYEAIIIRFRRLVLTLPASRERILNFTAGPREGVQDTKQTDTLAPIVQYPIGILIE